MNRRDLILVSIATSLSMLLPVKKILFDKSEDDSVGLSDENLKQTFFTCLEKLQKINSCKVRLERNLTSNNHRNRLQVTQEELSHLIVNDFAVGATVNVNGWILSKTELKLGAIIRS